MVKEISEYPKLRQKTFADLEASTKLLLRRNFFLDKGRDPSTEELEQFYKKTYYKK